MNEINGVICINKPQDFTSFDVVAIMRRAAGTRKSVTAVRLTLWRQAFCRYVSAERQRQPT
ncbi:MAG: hypothetical protein ACLS48_05935 [[Eubacterium] siraeum]